MARAPADDGSAFLLEVDDEYRRDRLARLGRRFGLWAALAVVLLLAALAGLLVWREQQEERAAALADRFLAVIDRVEAGDQAADRELADIAAEAMPAYRALAVLARASIAVRAGKATAAAGLYGAIAADQAIPEELRAVAALRQARLQFGSTAPEQTIARLRAYAQPGDPWFGPAGELTALAYLKASKPAQAGPLLAAIAGDAAQPPSLRLRAGEMAQSLGAAPAGPAPMRGAAAPAGSEVAGSEAERSQAAGNAAGNAAARRGEVAGAAAPAGGATEK